jgi:hypothetical protein
MPRYNIGVYNAEVRELVRDGRRHPNLKDSWGDTHYLDVEASDKAEAYSKIQRRYPKHLGYVITDVVEEK